MTETNSARRAWDGKSNSGDGGSWRMVTLAQTDLTLWRSCKGSRNVVELSGEGTQEKHKGYDYFRGVSKSINK